MHALSMVFGMRHKAIIKFFTGIISGILTCMTIGITDHYKVFDLFDEWYNRPDRIGWDLRKTGLR